MLIGGAVESDEAGQQHRRQCVPREEGEQEAGRGVQGNHDDERTGLPEPVDEVAARSCRQRAEQAGQADGEPGSADALGDVLHLEEHRQADHRVGQPPERGREKQREARREFAGSPGSWSLTAPYGRMVPMSTRTHRTSGRCAATCSKVAAAVIARVDAAIARAEGRRPLRRCRIGAGAGGVAQHDGPAVVGQPGLVRVHVPPASPVRHTRSRPSGGMRSLVGLDRHDPDGARPCRVRDHHEAEVGGQAVGDRGPGAGRRRRMR